MRILIVNDHLGHDGGVFHGVTRYILDVVPRLREFADPTICLLRGRHPAAEVLERRGIEPIFLRRGKWDPRALRDLHDLVRYRGFDLLHLMGMKGILLGRLVARSTGLPAIIHLHDLNPISRPLEMVQRRLAPWTAAALAVSTPVAWVATELMGIPETRVRVLHNGIPLEEFDEVDPAEGATLRADLGITTDARVIGLLSRFVPGKGHETAIGALPAVLAWCPSAVLLLVGAGPLRERCEAQVRSLGLESNVRFAGQRDDVGAVLRACDVVCLPSRQEGLGYVALEAMATGKPVVASAVGGIPELVVDGETGVLVPPDDTDALAAALVRMLTSPELATRLGQAGRRRADGFSTRRHVEELEVIYRSVLGLEPVSQARVAAARHGHVRDLGGRSA